ncbi:MAG: hypothetical protein ABII90_02785 [Bacteroidota bacterium]
MMNLKKKIEIFLKARDKTMKDLADYLKLSEDDLNNALSDNTLEIRTLENISKALRIPLFSFFHDPLAPEPKKEIPYYTEKLPETEEFDVKTERQMLQSEIKMLQRAIKGKEETLRQLKKDDS